MIEIRDKSICFKKAFIKIKVGLEFKKIII